MAQPRHAIDPGFLSLPPGRVRDQGAALAYGTAYEP